MYIFRQHKTVLIFGAAKKKKQVKQGVQPLQTLPQQCLGQRSALERNL